MPRLKKKSAEKRAAEDKHRKQKEKQAQTVPATAADAKKDATLHDVETSSSAAIGSLSKGDKKQAATVPVEADDATLHDVVTSSSTASGLFSKGDNQGESSSKDLLADYFSDQRQKQKNKMVLLRGNIHQGSPVFQENAGKQCTCNCCIFLIHAFQCDLENLSPHLQDNLLQDGNRLYQKLSKLHNQDFLMVKELEGIILYNSQYYKMSIVHEWSGLTASSFNFFYAINTLTRNYQYAFLLIGGDGDVAYTTTIYSEGNTCNVYIFDPHSRNVHGYPSSTGSAIVMNFGSIPILNNYLSRMVKYLKATHYEIAAVNFQLDIKNHYETNIRKIKRSHLSDSTKKEIKAKDAHYQQNKRSHLDEATKMNIKEKDLKSRQAKRSHLDKVTKMNIKEKNTKSRQAKRSHLDKVTKMNIKEKDLKSRQAKRSQLDQVTKMNIKEKNTKSRQAKRSHLDKVTKMNIKEKNTKSRQAKRSHLDEVTKMNIRVDVIAPRTRMH